MTSQPVNPCPKCGRENRPNARFCGACQTPLPQSAASSAPAPAAAITPPVPVQSGTPAPTPQVDQPPASIPSAAAASAASGFCPSCGGSVTPGLRFCRHCGQDLHAVGVVSGGSTIPAQVAPTPTVAPPVQTPPMPPMVAPLPIPSQPPPTVTGARSRRVTIPGWLWLIIGLLLGLLISAAVIFWMPEVVRLQPIESTPAASVEETPLSQPDEGTGTPETP